MKRLTLLIILVLYFLLDLKVNAQMITVPTFRKDYTGIIERHYNELKFGGNYLEAEMVNYYLYLPEDKTNETQSYYANNLFIDWYFSVPQTIAVGVDVSLEAWKGDLIKSTNLDARELGKTNIFNFNFNNVDIVFPWINPLIKFIRIGKQWLNYSPYSLARVWGLKGIMVDGKILAPFHYNLFYTWNKNSTVYTPSSYNNLSYYYKFDNDEGRVYGWKLDYIFTGIGDFDILQGAKFSFIGVNYNSIKSNVIIREEKTYEGNFSYSFSIFTITGRYVERWHNEYFEDDGLGNISTNNYFDTAEEYKLKINDLKLFDYLMILYRRVGKNFVPWNPKKWLRYPPFFTRDYLNDTPDRPLYTDEESYILYAHKELNGFLMNLRWDEGFNLSGDPLKYEFLWGNGIVKRNMFIVELSYYFNNISFIYQYKVENYYREKTATYIKEKSTINYNSFRISLHPLENLKFDIGSVLQYGYLNPSVKVWDNENKDYLIRTYFTLSWMVTKKIELRAAGSFMNPNPLNLYTSYIGWREGPNFVTETKEWYGDFSDNFIRIGIFTKF